MQADVIQILISQAAILGIGFLWFNFNRKVFYTVYDIVDKTFNENNDSPVEPDDEVFDEEDE